MKKAYVKPVFLADSFVMTANVAACKTGVDRALKLYTGLDVCAGCNGDTIKTNKGYVGQTYADFEDGSKTYWQYAGGTDNPTTSDAYLFNTSSLDYAKCDFLWTPTSSQDMSSTIWVWNDESRTQDAETGKWNIRDTFRTFAQFFCGNNGTDKQHYPTYNDNDFFS